MSQVKKKMQSSTDLSPLQKDMMETKKKIYYLMQNSNTDIKFYFHPVYQNKVKYEVWLKLPYSINGFYNKVILCFTLSALL